MAERLKELQLYSSLITHRGWFAQIKTSKQLFIISLQGWIFSIKSYWIILDKSQDRGVSNQGGGGFPPVSMSGWN